MDDIELSERDLEQLARRGITPDDAERQIRLLRRPPWPTVLERPCTVGDGIERIAPEAIEPLARSAAAAAEAGELAAFVPASGAATRMFRDLLACLADDRALTRDEIEADRRAGLATTGVLLAFVDALPRFAFHAELERALEHAGYSPDRLIARGPYRPLLEALLAEPGLGYASLPKGLIPFHAAPDGPRTAFEEHLADAAALVRDRDEVCRLHVTVAPEHRGRFESVLERARGRPDGRRAVRYEVTFSTQDPATDTLAVDEAGDPIRDADGSLAFRPAGHGALLANLAAIDGPIALIRNIDNVAAEPFKAPTLAWTRVLVGRLRALLARRDALLARLEDPRDDGAADEALRFARDTLGREAAESPAAGPAARRSHALALLDRPLRVCGMVPNTGEPGGGPFWTVDRHGRRSRQIVESSEVHPTEADQQSHFRAATHFNPVLMACALHDARGGRYPLERFADPGAVIITRKSAGGREVTALERPGLWNGAMAHWGTVFVEVPNPVFNPVKTVLDLLRPEHQP